MVHLMKLTVLVHVSARLESVENVDSASATTLADDVPSAAEIRHASGGSCDGRTMKKMEGDEGKDLWCNEGPMQGEWNNVKTEEECLGYKVSNRKKPPNDQVFACKWENRGGTMKCVMGDACD